MKESTASTTSVVDLARYRTRAQQAQQEDQKMARTPIPDDLLDTITYHLLMAGRAIAAYDKN